MYIVCNFVRVKSNGHVIPRYNFNVIVFQSFDSTSGACSHIFFFFF